MADHRESLIVAVLVLAFVGVATASYPVWPFEWWTSTLLVFFFFVIFGASSPEEN